MSAPTPPSRSPHQPASPDARTEWLLPRPRTGEGVPDAAHPLVIPARSTLGTVFEVAARLGTAITLAALLIVTGTVLTLLDAEPTPTGAATAGR